MMLTFLVVDSQLETGRTPFDKVEAGLGLEGCNSSVTVAWHNVTTVQQCDSHIFSLSRVADNHLIMRLEALEGKIHDFVTLMRGFIARDDRRVTDKRVMNSRVGYKIGLEFVQIDIEGTIKT